MALQLHTNYHHHHHHSSPRKSFSHPSPASISSFGCFNSCLSWKYNSSFITPSHYSHHSFASPRPLTQRLLICSPPPRKRPTSLRAQLSLPLVPASSHWAMWSILLSVAAFGIWSEKTTWGSSLSGALVSTLVGLVASNAGIIPSTAPAFTVVNKFLLPLSVPLLLFSADLRVVVTSTGRLLLAFCLGSVATVVGTIIAMMVVPLHSLGADGWKIASALMSRHIGGAVNYVAVSEAFGVSSSVLAAGLAADNLMCALYFTTIFALASRVPKEASSAEIEVAPTSQVAPQGQGQGGPRAYLLESATALALSACICTVGVYVAHSLGFQGGDIPCITVIVVLLATVCPSWVGSLAPAGEMLAMILIQIFFTVVGASASVSNVMGTATRIFLFCLVQVAVHLVLVLGIGRILGFDQKNLLVASNANVGGPTTAASLTTAKGWKELIVPGILVGIFGVAIATFIAIFLGLTVLKRM